MNLYDGSSCDSTNTVTVEALHFKKQTRASSGEFSLEASRRKWVRGRMGKSNIRMRIRKRG